MDTAGIGLMTTSEAMRRNNLTARYGEVAGCTTIRREIEGREAEIARIRAENPWMDSNPYMVGTPKAEQDHRRRLIRRIKDLRDDIVILEGIRASGVCAD